MRVGPPSEDEPSVTPWRHRAATIGLGREWTAPARQPSAPGPEAKVGQVNGQVCRGPGTARFTTFRASHGAGRSMMIAVIRQLLRRG